MFMIYEELDFGVNLTQFYLIQHPTGVICKDRGLMRLIFLVIEQKLWFIQSKTPDIDSNHKYHFIFLRSGLDKAQSAQTMNDRVLFCAQFL